MASFFGSCIIIIIIIIATISIPVGASNQYKVGDTEGWQLPDEKNAELYKIRASKITFLVGDSIVFKYKNDSVVKVDKRGYYHCNETSSEGLILRMETLYFFLISLDSTTLQAATLTTVEKARG